MFILLAACAEEREDDRITAESVLDDMEEADLVNDEGFWAVARGEMAPAMILSAFVFGAWLGDESCPAVEETDGVTLYEGGCTTEDGYAFVGSLAYDESGVEVDGFGLEIPAEGCEVAGSVRTWGFWSDDVSEDRSSWRRSADAVTIIAAPDEACELQRIESAAWWEGETLTSGEDRDDDGYPDVTTSSGVGEYGMTGHGRVASESEDIVSDAWECPDEPISGLVTVSAGDHVVRYRYDGAEACDEAVRWELDGEDQGTWSLAGEE